MKSDLNALMHERNIDALLITGPAQNNPPMVYLTGGGHMGQADLIMKRDQEPVLFHNSMERDEAAKTGLRTKSYSDYSLPELLKQAAGDFGQATILRYEQMLADVGITSGRVAVAGRIDAGSAWAIFSALEKRLPGLEFVGELNDTILLSAMATKEPAEVERIRRMGRITTEVVDLVARYLTGHKVQDGVLVKAGGLPLTIGDVKSKIKLWLAERGAEDTEGTIFAIGRDAGVPHSTGSPEDPLELGKTIVFDIFPSEAGGGYHYDFTRTWCLGYAPDEVQALYNDVLAVFQQVMSELRVGMHCADLQDRSSQLFEAQGHPTIMTNPSTEVGYVHSLGHGLGLYVHERPMFGRNATDKDVLIPGTVVTIEPGLYYPEKGMGVRLEDTVYVTPEGNFEILAKYPLDLVLRMEQ